MQRATTRNWFLFEDPELDWSTRLQIIPSLTERGRVRGELNTALSCEVIGDLLRFLIWWSGVDSVSRAPEVGAFARVVDFSYICVRITHI